MGTKLTQKEFIEKAINIHGSYQYRYNLVDYKNNATKVKIVCPPHGVFLQTPRDHLTGRGCFQCSLENKSNEQRMSLKNFIEKAINVHGAGKYDYSLVKFKNNKSKIRIVCLKHGIFDQKLSLHLSGSGCQICGIEARAKTHLYSTEEFIKLSIKKHGNKYDYSTTKYIRNSIAVEIKCKTHGVFSQKPNDHLDGHGCAKCAKNISNMETCWLDIKKIPVENRNITIRVGKKRFYADGYYNGIIYEFYGDFWHGNPIMYPPQDFCKITKKTFGDMYYDTMNRKSLLEKAGYTVVCEWENNFRDTYEKLRKSDWRGCKN